VTLHRERDLPAKERRRGVMNQLVRLLADEAVKQAVKEEEGSTR